MKKIQIDEEIRNDQKLLADVLRVTELLEEEIGPASNEISTKWSVELTPLERLLKVEISDGQLSSRSAFSESGLSLISRAGMRLSLNRLWGNLLQDRSHQQMAKLKLVVQGLQDN
jgi:hypothetical protein